ncbi:uncharacterized protein LOC119446010 [Dermacentor silvarum]|uniref:uncharacterized protein LOC119446010 n=1 Tax=Dermacentor silvarum TaxID=543639 RepID=UPI00189B4E43|nr:uncharacterized protein LOC119446010 [Dermacentor silvarum]
MFGHEEHDCTLSYASVTGPVGGDDSSELLMDERDAEDAASSGDGALATTDLAKASGPNATTGNSPLTSRWSHNPGIATASERPESSEPPAKEPDATTGQDNMDQSESAAGGLAGKRPWDEGRDETSTPDSGSGGEPPTKAAGNRRPSFKPRPTIPAGPRAEAKPPLQSTPPG